MTKNLLFTVTNDLSYDQRMHRRSSHCRVLDPSPLRLRDKAEHYVRRPHTSRDEFIGNFEFCPVLLHPHLSVANVEMQERAVSKTPSVPANVDQLLVVVDKIGDDLPFNAGSIGIRTGSKFLKEVCDNFLIMNYFIHFSIISSS